MKGVTFGQYHSYATFGLILNSKEIAAPKVKIISIDVPGADGALDWTEFFGEPKYENVIHKFKFSIAAPKSEHLTRYSTIKNTLHGKKLRIILDDDPGFFYVGRCYVLPLTTSSGIGKVTIEADCEPYKLKIRETTVSFVLDGISNNLYNIDNVPLIGNVRKTVDNFFTLDVTNTGDSTLFPTFRHSVYAAGRITPNQSVSLVMEIQSCEISPVDSVRFFFTSNFTAQPDYFGRDEFSFLLKNGAGMIVIFPTTIKDAATIANAALFMRSFFNIPVGSSIKAKFRISVVQGAVSEDGFTYVSPDGTMKGLRLQNLRKRVTPAITADSTFTLFFGGNNYEIAAGTTTMPEIELQYGINDVLVTGTGTIGFAYREGGL